MAISIVILAAGQGKRMHSQCPKVLHRIAGKPLLEHVVNTATKLNSNEPPIVVYGHQGDKVRHALSHLDVTWVEQSVALGTGNALLQALPYVPPGHQVLVLYGDVPLISYETLHHFLATTPENTLGVVTARLNDPTGFGRIVRDTNSKILRIVEEKDANETERLLNEINSGIYSVPDHYLKQWLPKLENHNTQKEFYLTDIIQMAVNFNVPIVNYLSHNSMEILGVNDLQQLAELERYYQTHYAKKLMLQGVTLRDPARFDVRGDLTVGHDVTIDINVIIEGTVKIGNHCHIGPHVILRNTTLADHVEVNAMSIIDGAEIAEAASIGPFARVRPGTVVGDHAYVGNFIEIKNSLIGPHTKIHHVGYIGDSELGAHVNIGAGTITCNYDGANKHKTIIEDNAFIGSNSELVAPVKIGKGATIGAGSTITRDAPANQLTLSRTPQRTVLNWQPKTKQIKEQE